MKYCRKGNHEVPIEGFFKDKSKKDGLSTSCKECKKKPPTARIGKLCPRCKTDKPREQFYTSPSRHDGLSSYCSECTNEMKREETIQRRLRMPKYTAPDGYKYCSGCDKTKPIDDFHANSYKSDGRSSWCKSCIKEKAPKTDEMIWENGIYTKYRLRIPDYIEILKSQNYCCATCGRHESEFNKRLAVDHDHSCCPGSKSCGECIRGLLCFDCNTSLGFVKDSVETLQSMIDYLSKN